MSIRFIKVKIKSLAEEARIIRLEERRSHTELRNQLHGHRVVTVRRAARAALLAYGFLRGRTIAQVDPGLSLFFMPEAQVAMEALKLVRKYGMERVLNCDRERDLTRGADWLQVWWKDWLDGGAGLRKDDGISTPARRGFDSPPALQQGVAA